MMYNASTFNNKKKHDIKLRGSQVVPFVDQRGLVKQKFNDLRTNGLDVYFNLTKDMTGSFLSNQF